MPTPKTQCLVIPLTKKSKPYKAYLSRTDPTQNCLVYDLEQLKSKQPFFSAHQLMDWRRILAAHLKTEAKLMLKDMGEYGTGAFVKSKIMARELLIYPGQLIDTEIHNDLTLEDRIYFLHIPKEPDLHVDAKYTECMAKYFQHLPLQDPKAVSDFDGEIPAYENFGSNCAYVEIHCENESYIVPVRVFLARRDILPDTIAGFDYGKLYWQCLNRDFTYFTAAGHPISCYYLSANKTKYQLTLSAYTSLLYDGFFMDSKRLLFFPREVRETLDDVLPPLSNEGTVSLSVPAIVEIKLKNCKIYYDETQRLAKAILIIVPDHITRISIYPDLLTFSAVQEFPEPAPIPPVSLSKMLDASIAELSRFTKAVDRIMTSPLTLEIQPCAELAGEKVIIFSLIKQGLFKERNKMEFSQADGLEMSERRLSI